MGYGTGDAELQTLLLASDAGKESALGIVGEWSAQRVAHIIGECRYTVEPLRVSLRCQFLDRVGALASTPPLAIDEDGGVYLVHLITYDVHRLDVMNTHEVEAEAVDMILVNPVFHRLYHETAHHRLLACRLIAAARAVGINQPLTLPKGESA